METIQKPSLWQGVQAVVKRLLTDIDVLPAIFLAATFISPSLSTLLDVKNPVYSVGLFSLWGLAFILNHFLLKKNRYPGGPGAFFKAILQSKRLIELLLLGAWVLVLLINVLLKRGVNGHISFSYFAIFLAFYVMDFCYELVGERWKAQYMIYGALCTFAVEGIRSSIHLNWRPWDSRLLSADYFSEARRNRLLLMGLGGYEFFTGLSILTGSLLLYTLKANRRWVGICLFALMMFILYMSGYSFNLMFIALALLCAMIYNARKVVGKDRVLVNILSIGVAVLYLFLFFFCRTPPLRIRPNEVYLHKVNSILNNTIIPHWNAFWGIKPTPKPTPSLEPTPSPALIPSPTPQGFMGYTLLTYHNAAEETPAPAETIPLPSPEPLPTEPSNIDTVTQEMLDAVLLEPLPPGLGQLGIRLTLYRTSLQTFLQNPLFGIGPAINEFVRGIGGHSTWLDYLAMYGLLGFGFFIAFHVLLYRRIWKNTSGSERFYRCLTFWIFTFYGLVNPVIHFRVFPLVLCLFIGGNMPAKDEAPSPEQP